MADWCNHEDHKLEDCPLILIPEISEESIKYALAVRKAEQRVIEAALALYNQGDYGVCSRPALAGACAALAAVRNKGGKDG